MRERIRKLQHLTSGLVRLQTFAEIGSYCSAQLCNVASADMCWIGRVSDDERHLESIGVHGVDRAVADTRTRFPLDAKYPVCEVIRTGKALWYSSNDDLFADFPDHADTARQIDRKAAAFIPLIVGGDGERRAVGAMSLGFKLDQPFDEDIRSFLLSLSEQIGQALDRARLYENLAASEAALRASEARLQLALDLAGLGTWSIDVATGTGSIDTRGAAIVGLKPGELQDVAASQMERVHPDDIQKLHESLGAAMKNGGVFDLAYRVIFEDASVHHVASRGRVITDESGNPVQMVGTNRDVTLDVESEARLRASEARYHAIVEQGPAALAVVEGRDQVFSLVSPAYESWARHGPLTGRSFLEVAPELRGSTFDRAHRHVYETGEPVTLREQKVLMDTDGDGIPEEHFYTTHYTALRNDEGKIFAVCTLASDVTATVRARREAEEARALAESANRAKSEFLAVMSHELRTPLNAIGGYAELMEMGIRGPVTREQGEDLRRIQQSQRHLLGLINQVLNYTRVSAGAVEYDVVEIPVSEAVAAAEALVMPQIRSRGLNYRLEAVDSSMVVRADREKLQQILLNLLSNAIKFTEPGGEILLSCRNGDSGVAMAVRDTGAGIPEEKLATIFEPFVQVHQGLTRSHEGVGLGLAISRDLARGMGGDLVASSAQGKGSTFTLTLPAG